jgi:hypothetical protein
MRKTAMPASLLLALVVAGFLHGDGRDRSIRNLDAFARLYGYVRFFYPGDEAAALDWERFAAYGVKRAGSARDDAELKSVLEDLFGPVAPALRISASVPSAAFPTAEITPPGADGMKTVGWQHHGYGFGPSNAIYQSVRLNRKTALASDEAFGTITRCLDAAPFRGSEIRLRAAVRAVSGQGQLWLRVDRPGGQSGFFDNMGDRPVRSGRWDRYEIAGPVAPDATQVCFGCILSGRGEIYADDFELSVKPTGGRSWKAVPLGNGGFEDDGDGRAPSQWAAMKMRTYSFLVSASEAASGKKSVCIKGRVDSISGPLPFFPSRPKIGDFISKDIGAGLSCLMPLALYGDEARTYPAAPADRLSRLKGALARALPEDPSLISGNDVDVRLADVVIAWNVFRHFYPYFDVVRADWPAALGAGLAAAYADRTALDFLRTLKRFTAGLEDGHVWVGLRGDDREEFSLPLDWEWIEDRLVVTRILDPGLQGVRAGDVVETWNGAPARDALAEKVREISAATPGWRRYRALAALRSGAKNEIVRLEVRAEGGIRPVSLAASLAAMAHRTRLRADAVKTKILGDGIRYLNLDLISWPEIEALLPDLQKARAIVCDLRGYPNGNHLLIAHLLTKPDQARWMGIPQIIRPDFEQVEYQRTGWFLRPKTPHLAAKMVFITDGRAISYAESFLGYIQGYKLATIVGQPTAGTNGNVNALELPGGYSVSWTGMRVEKIDGGRHHGVGVVPDVPAERTIRGVRDGRDELLEKALEIARR